MTRHCECPDTIDPDGRCSRCGLPRDSVTIPRVEYKALMEAADRILRSYPGHTYSGHGECGCVHCEGNKAAAALRAAGTQTEGEGK